MVLTAFLLGIGFFRISEPFHACFSQYKHDHRYGEIYDLSASPLARAVSRVGLNFRCGDDTLNADSSGIVAIFTIALAITSFLQWSAIKRQADTADKQRVADENARVADSQRLSESLEAAKKSADASVEAAAATQQFAGAARQQVVAMTTQAEALQRALIVEAPKLWVYGIGQIVDKEDFDGTTYYEISYKVINVGRAPAIIEIVWDGVQVDLSVLHAPEVAKPWHVLRTSPIVPVNAVVEVPIIFPHEDVVVEGRHLPDSGGQAYDYFIPEPGTNPVVLVSITYRGATTDSDRFQVAWVFNREHGVWVETES